MPDARAQGEGTHKEDGDHAQHQRPMPQGRRQQPFIILRSPVQEHLNAVVNAAKPSVRFMFLAVVGTRCAFAGLLMLVGEELVAHHRHERSRQQERREHREK